MNSPLTENPASQQDMRGHNAHHITLTVEVRLFNSLSKFADAHRAPHKVEVHAGSTVGDLIRCLNLPVNKIFLVLRNGRDITKGLYSGGNINQVVALEDGDVIAFSGPVPYSYGYVAPVV